MNQPTHRLVGDTLSAVLRLLAKTPAPEPGGYFETTGRVDVDAGPDTARFIVSLVHVPISEEAAVEEDRFSFRIDSAGIHDDEPLGSDSFPATSDGLAQFLEHLGDVVSQHWRS